MSALCQKRTFRAKELLESDNDVPFDIFIQYDDE
jgi:hypothetical protein